MFIKLLSFLFTISMGVFSQNIKCDELATIDRHDIKCKYRSSISISTNDYVDKWKVTYPSISSEIISSSSFAQFVFVKIITLSTNSLFIKPLIRQSCDYSFQSELQFRSHDNGQNVIYTIILPSCNTQSIEMCTYYIVIEATNDLIDDQHKNINLTKAEYELTASLGILLQFQQKYSYSSPSTSPGSSQQNNNDENDDSNSENMDSTKYANEQIIAMRGIENKDDILNASCLNQQFYGLKPSISDFPIGIIIQPEFIGSDTSITINQYTSSPNTKILTNKINKLKGDAESESYDVPSNGYITSSDYVLLSVVLQSENDDTILHNIKYILYSQSNISYIQVNVINSGGWFLMLILVFLICIAMCRKHCCLRDSDQRLSYNDILENIQLQNPLFLNLNGDAAAGSSTQNADDQKSIGIQSEDLNNVSVIETYFIKKSIFRRKKTQKNKYKYKACCICLYDYRNGDKLRKLKCSHYFHQKCIDVWFERKTHCPLCKQSVINAKMLSKKESNSSISLDMSSSMSLSEKTTSSSSRLSGFGLSSTESEEEKEKESGIELMDMRSKVDVCHKYSLSDSYIKPKEAMMSVSSSNHHKYVSDDPTQYQMVARHRKYNSQSQSYHSQSAHSSVSLSGQGEIVMNHGSGHESMNNQNNFNMNPFTSTHHTHAMTVTTTTTVSTNDISLSSSPTDILGNTEDYHKSFLPLTPNINLFFDKAQQNQKQE